MAPRLMDYGDAIDTLWEEAVYTEARLTSEPLAQHLATRFHDYLTALEAVRSGQYSVWRAEVVAQAAVDAADDALDTAVRATGRALDTAVDSRHDDPRWVRYVGRSTPRKIALLALDAELKVVRSWPDSLKTEPERPLRATAVPLAESIARGDVAVKQRDDAQAKRRDFMARDKVRLVDALNDLRLDTHADLSKLVVPNRLDRAWPDGFFRRGAKATASVERDEPADPQPARPA